ncbi:30S ribosomal protein S17 [Candidatus Saccharibacteria bacterium]|nr:30S ribosomal protein S17 [Candidatus Saccharibacteria bacterium]
MSRLLTGRVSSDKPDKTIVITVATRKTHPLYKKQYTINTKFMAHDEKNLAKIGDLVIIKESRPISARKRFTLDRILESARGGFEEQDAIADVPQEAPEGAIKELRSNQKLETAKITQSKDKDKKK